MNRKQRKELRQRQSTQQLMGIIRLTEHGVLTRKGEYVFVLVRPDNLAVLSNESIESRVRALLSYICSTDDIRMLALDSRESFAQNKAYYQERREAEQNPAIGALLKLDRSHLDEIQTTTVSAREFAFSFKLDRRGDENVESSLATITKNIRDKGFHVHLADRQDVMRILAVYYQHDVTTEHFDNYDGESVVMNNGL